MTSTMRTVQPVQPDGPGPPEALRLRGLPLPEPAEGWRGSARRRSA
ncbi:hypothetical protein ACIQXD_36300 [Streptomyces uncialis]